MLILLTEVDMMIIFSSHAKQLRIFSESLRDELVKEDEKKRDRRG